MLSHALEKSVSRLQSPLKITLFDVFDLPDGFFEVLVVSDWFHKVP